MPDFSYRDALACAISAARQAGAALRQELHREGGPRGPHGHCPADLEVEALIREHLDASFPAFGFRGEEQPELNRLPALGERHCWLVDPNDGTTSMQNGFRGSAVSIGLICDDAPVLGVIFAYAAPDDDGDLIAWALGEGPVTRNGAPLPPRIWPEALSAADTVLLSQQADTRPEAHAARVAPARYRPIPGIAYRLALVAAGEGVAALSLFGPRDFDYAAGHALLRGAGGVLLDHRGREVKYLLERERSLIFCFGGGPAIARALVDADWDGLLRAHPVATEPFDLVWPQAGTLVEDAGRVCRAQGAMLGQLIGNALGGQPAELAVLLARAIIDRGRYDEKYAALAYAHALGTGPDDLEEMTAGALIRIGPLGIFGAGLLETSSSILTSFARADASLTHADVACQDANAVFVMTIARAISSGATGRELYEAARNDAREMGACAEVKAWLEEALESPPTEGASPAGALRFALINAFSRLRTGQSAERAVEETVGMGGYSAAKAAICGVLLGAAQGREAWPMKWRDRVLTFRPIEGAPDISRPRPRAVWAVDALVLAERLLFHGRAVSI